MLVIAKSPPMTALTFEMFSGGIVVIIFMNGQMLVTHATTPRTVGITIKSQESNVLICKDSGTTIFNFLVKPQYMLHREPIRIANRMVRE